MMRFTQTTLIPNMAAALSSNLDGPLTRELVRVYVETNRQRARALPIRDGEQLGQQNKVVADSERIIARMLAVMLRRRTGRDWTPRGGAVGVP